MKIQELIEKCKKKDLHAQMEVYKLYKDALYNACWRIFKNKYDAEDAVHDAFIKGFNKIHLVNNQTNLGAWLKRIAVNHSIDIIRKRNEFWLEETAVHEQIVEEKPFDFESITIDKIKDCMDSLKKKYRIILILYLIENYTHREISDQLNIKESTVRNQYRRGKAMLAEVLKKKHHYEFKKTYTG